MYLNSAWHWILAHSRSRAKVSLELPFLEAVRPLVWPLELRTPHPHYEMTSHFWNHLHLGGWCVCSLPCCIQFSILIYILGAGGQHAIHYRLKKKKSHRQLLLSWMVRTTGSGWIAQFLTSCCFGIVATQPYEPHILSRWKMPCRCTAEKFCGQRAGK